jgi:hypothetical protein
VSRAMERKICTIHFEFSSFVPNETTTTCMSEYDNLPSQMHYLHYQKQNLHRQIVNFCYK